MKESLEPPSNPPERTKEPLDFVERKEEGDVVLRRGSHEVSLGSYLPAGWRFKPVDSYINYGQHEVHYDEKTVKYNAGELKNKESREYAMVSLLHELGHIENEMEERMPEADPSRESLELARVYKTYMHNIDWFEMCVAAEKLSLDEIKSMQPAEIRERVREFIKSDEKLKERFLEATAEKYKHERNAWATALKMLRELQANGLETAVTQEALIKYVHTRLGTYEVNSLEELKQYGLEKSEVAKDIERRKKAMRDDLAEEESRQLAKRFGGVD